MGKLCLQILNRCAQSTLLFCILAAGMVMSCDNRVNDTVFSPELISEIQQEQLGDQIFDALTSSSSPFTVLSKEEHENLYNYIYPLYIQSYRILRAKYNWSKDRDWKVAIIESENQSAFTLPGGNIIITTEMLKALRAEYELYYLFSFENALMNNDEIYLSNIVSFIENTIGIVELINNPDPTKALEIGLELYAEQSFDDFEIANVDRNTMEMICESGSWRNDGIVQFLNRLDPNSPWMTSRPSSLNRINMIQNNAQEIGCGNTIRERSPNFYIDVICPLIP